MGAPLKQIGRYTVLEVLGRGPIGTVYKARDQEIGRLVAIKTFGTDDTELPEAEALSRFRAEARAAGSLRHPNIVTLFEASTTVSDQFDGGGGEIPYIVMDFVEGEGLQTILAREKTLAKARTVRYLHSLAGALDYAHSRRVVHGELKPSNIIIDKRDQLYIRDFGVSLMQTSLHDEEEARVGHAYDAPEVILGKPSDYRADLFSLAVVIFECLTGVHPFGAGGRERLVESITHHSPEPPSSLDPQLSISVDIVFSHALAKIPGDRYPNARAFYEALARALDEPPQPVLASSNLVGPVTVEPLMPPLVRQGEVPPGKPKEEEPLPHVPLRSRVLFLLVMVGAIYLTYSYKEAGSFSAFIDSLKPSDERIYELVDTARATRVGQWAQRRWEPLFAAYHEWRNPPPPTDGRAVGALTDKEVLALMVSAKDNEKRVKEALLEAQKRRIPVTGMAPFLLNSPFPSIRAEGVKILGTRKDTAAVNELLTRLSDSDPGVRLLVVERLALVDEPRIIPALNAALSREEDERVRRVLKKYIDNFSPEVILPGL